MITEETFRKANISFFKRHTSKVPCQEHDIIYFFVHPLVELSKNKGLQEISRMLSSSLLSLNKKIRFVKWDDKIGSLVYTNSTEMAYLRKKSWLVPTPEDADFFSKTIMSGSEVPLHNGQNNWLIVPDIPYLMSNNELQPIYLITTARFLGIKTVFISCAAEFTLSPEMADPVLNQNEYIRQLQAADVVLTISDKSNHPLRAFITHEKFNPENEKNQNWSGNNLSPTKSFIGPNLTDHAPATKSEPAILNIHSLKAVGVKPEETWAQYSKQLLNILARENASVFYHSSTSVSIIIPVHNNVDLTKQCIESILSQNIITDYEIIVVDDASTDNTPAYLKSIGDRVRVVRNSKNIHFAGSCNAGSKIAHGKYLLFLNNDTIPEKGWLDAMFSRIISDPGIGIVGAKLLYPDRTIQHCGIVFKPDTSGFRPVHRLRNTPEHNQQATYPMQFSAVTGACILIRREIFHRLSGFNESFKMYFEDIDFCLSAQKIGYTIVYEPLASIIHFERETFSNSINDLMRQSFIIFNYKWKDTIKSLGPLRDGIPYTKITANDFSSSDKSTQTFLRKCPSDFQQSF